MGTFSIWHWIIVLAVILLLFGGRGKIPNLMRDMGQGINASPAIVGDTIYIRGNTHLFCIGATP